MCILEPEKARYAFFMVLSHHILTVRKGIKSHMVVVATPLIPASGKQRQAFLASQVYRARLRIAGATQRNPMLDASEEKI